MVHECPACNARWRTTVRNPQQCQHCNGSLTSTRIVPETEPTPVRIVGQVIDNSHGGSPVGGDLTFALLVVCWPIGIPLLVLYLIYLWIFGDRIAEKEAEKRAQHEAAITVRNERIHRQRNQPAIERAERYEAEGNTAMAEHTRTLYCLPSKVTATSYDSPET